MATTVNHNYGVERQAGIPPMLAVPVSGAVFIKIKNTNDEIVGETTSTSQGLWRHSFQLENGSYIVEFSGRFRPIGIGFHSSFTKTVTSTTVNIAVPLTSVFIPDRVSTTGGVGATGVEGPPGTMGIEGPIGPHGIAGDIGPTGPEGEMGPAGPEGVPGVPGIRGTQGPGGAKGTLGSQGLVGPQGISGGQGLMGPVGETGPAGAGETGPDGADGSVGATGAIGETGPTGDPEVISVFGRKGTIIAVDGDYDASEVSYTPTTLGDWNSSADPGDADNALDQLAANLNPLLPPSAPVLDQIDYDTSDGASGKNTWNVAQPIGGFTDASGTGSVNNSGDTLDITMGTSGNEHGVYDFDTFVSCTGTLNEDVAGTNNYAANAFGPGGSDGGSTNDLKLYRNTTLLHTVDLLTDGGGSDLNGNGSGFSALSATANITFDDGVTEFSPKKYRTGTWIVVLADCVQGYNVIRVDHTTDSGTQSTNVHEFLLDGIDTATTFSGEALDTYVGSGSLELSGVNYHTGATAKYDITIDDAYRNTYKNGSPVTFNETNANALSNESLANSVGDEAKTHTITNKTVTVSSGRKINATLTISTSVNRTVQTDATSSGQGIAGMLIDNTSSSSTDLVDSFNDEDYRIKANDDFNTNLTSDWDSTVSLVGGDANHNTGLQVTEGKLYYPGGATISDYATAQAPAGNPDYGSSSGVRHYWRYMTDAVATSSFRLLISGTHTLISDTTSFSGSSHQQIKVALRWPTETGWLDLAVAFNEGNFGSTTEDDEFGSNAGDSLTHGCYQASLDSGGALGISIGTKTTASSFDKVFVRVITDANFNSNLTALTLTWNAS